MVAQLQVHASAAVSLVEFWFGLTLFEGGTAESDGNGILCGRP
jgi:hypothetical protein